MRTSEFALTANYQTFRKRAELAAKRGIPILTGRAV